VMSLGRDQRNEWRIASQAVEVGVAVQPRIWKAI